MLLFFIKMNSSAFDTLCGYVDFQFILIHQLSTRTIDIVRCSSSFGTQYTILYLHCCRFSFGNLNHFINMFANRKKNNFGVPQNVIVIFIFFFLGQLCICLATRIMHKLFILHSEPMSLEIDTVGRM